jgi:hypothetical protein
MGGETGDFTGWEQTLINGTQAVGAFDRTEGSFAANLNSDVEGTASLIKKDQVQ